jgi:outer membrane protein OmpA-like peptidoglycan-associated protein
MNAFPSHRVHVLPLFALLVAGCSTHPAPAADPQSRHVAVVVATATRNEPAPALAPETRRALTHLGDREDDATAFVVRSDREVRHIGLTPRRANGQVEHGPRRTSLLAANVARAADETSDVVAPADGLDLLGLLQEVPRLSVPPGLLVVISSGLSTVAPLDLRVVGWEAHPAAVADELDRDGFLPDLRGWRVMFSGLGTVSGDQPELPEPQRRTLVGYWLAICRAAGAATCTVSGEPDVIIPSRSTRTVPVVPVPAVLSVRGPSGDVVRRLPAALLFELDSAELDMSADPVLRDVIRTAAGGPLRITGYTDAGTGTPAHNLKLSRARAEAVGRRLIELGARPGQLTSVTGVGDAGTTPAAERTGGRPDPAKVAARRFVAIEFATARHGEGS